VIEDLFEYLWTKFPDFDPKLEVRSKSRHKEPKFHRRRCRRKRVVSFEVAEIVRVRDVIRKPKPIPEPIEKDYQYVLDKVKKFSKILVTGPQRSGTTIVSRMLGNDLGRKVYDEVGGVDFELLLKQDGDIVMQSPHICYRIHHFAEKKDLAVIFMVRNMMDILRSQKRIEWKGEKEETALYKQEFLNRLDYLNPICIIRREAWDKYQFDVLPNAWMLKYDSLEKHPMWVPKEKRVRFSAKRTQ
jgi:hypothetical protein